MKKKIVALLMVAALIISSFAACGEDNNGTTTNQGTQQSANQTTNNGNNDVVIPETPTAKPNFDVPAVGYDGSEVTLRFYHTMGSNLTDVLNIYIEEFNQLYPNIHIESEQVGGYDDVKSQISTMLTVEDSPNIAYNYPDHVAAYNMTGAVAALDNLINSKIEVTRADGSKEIIGLTDEQKADFVQGYYNEGRQFGDGLMYSLPFSKSTEVLYYNKTFFDANGLKVPTTWDEMEEVCKKIKAIDPESIPLGYDSEANWFINMCEQLKSPYTQANGSHYLFNNKTNRDFVERFRNWYQDGLLTTQTLYGTYTSGLFIAESGTRSYMSIGSSAGASHQRPAADTNGNYPFEVGIATIPQADANNRKVISQGPSVCIFAGKHSAQEVVASWLFVKFLTTSVEFQAEFSIASGYVPVLQSVAENEAYKAFLNQADGGKYVTALSAKVCMSQVDAYYTSPAFNGSSTARQQVGALLAKCLAAETKDAASMIEEAFEDAIDECEYNG
ncbi:MAG: extracellular solute-binding protein [Lachnospiraceae bacterium]|nr:extracellular solute-binding protein [Lachnospiraceae bacterium]